ncbi:MAG TPA: hypothetical protein VEF06_09760, partial [Bryobacteraceae bacterium]|nr:hypothetical protein [Bryobacteraceae bacterium]
MKRCFTREHEKGFVARRWPRGIVEAGGASGDDFGRGLRLGGQPAFFAPNDGSILSCGREKGDSPRVAS